jgi:hypothetical protein
MTQSTGNEDWIKTLSWDVRLPGGGPVATLDDLARALGVDQATAAARVLDLPFGSAAPPALLAEARRLRGA